MLVHILGVCYQGTCLALAVLYVILLCKPDNNFKIQSCRHEPPGCPTSDTVTLIVTPAFNINSRSDTAICLGRSVLLNTTTSGTTIGISYTWSPSTGLSNPNIASPLATPTTTTSYVVRASVGTCYSYDTVKITVNPSPIVDADDSHTNYCMDTVTFNAISTP